MSKESLWLVIALFIAVIALNIIWYWFIYKKSRGRGVKGFMLTELKYRYTGVVLLVLLFMIIGVALIFLSR